MTGAVIVGLGTDRGARYRLRGYRFVVLKCLMTGIKFSPITGGGAGCSLELPGAIRSSYSLVCILLSTTS